MKLTFSQLSSPQCLQGSVSERSTRSSASPGVMVNFSVDLARLGCLVIWSDISLDVAVEVFFRYE